MPYPGAWRVHRGLCACQNHVPDASTRPCVRRTHVPGESTKALSAAEPRAWGGSTTALRAPDPCACRVRRGPVCIGSISTAEFSSPGPRAWRVHTGPVCSRARCMVGSHCLLFVASTSGAWRVHRSASAARSTFLTVSRAFSAGSSACLGDLTTSRFGCLATWAARSAT